MMLASLLFYVFATVLVASAVMVVAARNPVHAVLFLILCFFNAAGLFVLLGAEFIAFIITIVYVGAVAVLFLFVVMMLDIDFRTLRQGFSRYVPVGAALGLVLMIELVLMAHGWSASAGAGAQASATEIASQAAGADNTRALGRVLYTDYFYPFQVAGLVLLTAMIGAIVLTLRERKATKRQKVGEQLNVRRADVVELRKVGIGEGVP